MAAVETMRDPRRRAEVVRELARELGSGFAVDPDADTWAIVSACLDVNGIQEFVGVLNLVEGDTSAWQALAALVEDLFPRRPLDAGDRIRITAVLDGLPPATIRRAMLLSDAISVSGWDEENVRGGTALELIENAVAQHQVDGETLWRFLEAVAHTGGEPVAAEMHGLIRAAAASMRVPDEVSAICRSMPWRGRDSAGDPSEQAILRETDVSIQSEQDLISGDDEMNRGIVINSLSVQSVPAVMRGLPPRNPFFAGRDEALESLHSTLEAKTSAMALPYTLQGLGGVGKTQLAIEYAYRYSGSYDLVWWIPASGEDSIRRSLVSLGKALGVPENSDVQYVIDSALDELRLGRLYSRWLLIFDNATEPQDIRKYFPQGMGHILVTTLSRSWAANSNLVEVDVFSAEESSAFLATRWPALTPEQSLALADKLGHLPLALDQAASFHEQTAMPAETYLNEVDLVSMLYYSTPTEYPQPVGATWRITFDKLREQSPAAAQLLQLCAFISSEPIAIPLLRGGRGADLPAELKEALRDELVFRKAVQELGKFALAQLDARRDFITVHNLVRAVLRDSLSPQERVENTHSAHEVLALANPGTPDRSDTWSRHAQLAPHIEDAGLVASEDPHVRQVVIDQIRYRFAIGDSTFSRQLAQRTFDVWRDKLGSDDVMTLRARFHLSNALRALGEYERARTESHETYQLLESTLGPDHTYCLQVSNSLGADLRFLGDFAAARVQDEETLERHRRVLGDDDLGTVRASHNLAVDLRLLGKFDASLQRDQDNLRRRLADDGGNASPETFDLVINIVRDLTGLGQYSLALRQQQEQLALFEIHLKNSRHRYLLDARRNIVILTRKLGEYGKAAKLAEAELDSSRAVNGPRHALTLAATMTLMNTLRAKRDLLNARTVGEEALAGYQERFVSEHPFILACAVNLAIVYRALNMREEAHELDEQTLQSLRRTLGDEHPYTIACMGNHTNNLAAAGLAEQSHALSQEVYDLAVAARGAHHPDTLASATNLALDLSAVGRHAEANNIRLQALQKLWETLGTEHPDTINVERGRRAEIDIEVPSL
ncbi:FxSxx-COOH system tetratricopeptide repeat protein [Catellatospora chokoriensis]|uniref:FxSxx-COOH system tetratricopeptide repeat protein n=1 Tax=Catellatospora chokoriensis TaxID=310353 RepID=UPI00177A9F03|nr:FxSxx-COOH system tetratricopeptide repeat protein [Catellatospora chokoriensis]